MKPFVKKIGLAMALFGLFNLTIAQGKMQTFKVVKQFDLPASEVWKVVGVDYGAVANSHPKIIASDYNSGSLKAEEGAERVCYFNEKQTQYLKEKIVNYDPVNMTFTNQVFKAGKFPVDPEVTRGNYRIVDLGNGKSEMHFEMFYRTKPAFMGGMMKGKFKGLIQDYFIAIEHHVRTGEAVTKENFKSIKKMYQS